MNGEGFLTKNISGFTRAIASVIVNEDMSRAPGLLQGLAYPALQLGVVEHEQLGFEERGITARNKTLHFRGGLFEGREEPLVLKIDL